MPKKRKKLYNLSKNLFFLFFDPNDNRVNNFVKNIFNLIELLLIIATINYIFIKTKSILMLVLLLITKTSWIVFVVKNMYQYIFYSWIKFKYENKYKKTIKFLNSNLSFWIFLILSGYFGWSLSTWTDKIVNQLIFSF